MDDAGSAQPLAIRIRDAIDLADELGLDDVALHLNTALVCLDGVGVVPNAASARNDMLSLARDILPPSHPLLGTG